MFALRTNVHVWRSSFFEALDCSLEKNGFSLIDMDWSAYALLKHDKDHFTWKGLKEFVKDLSKAIESLPGHVLVLSDSTLGYWDFSHSNEYNGKASHLLQSSLSSGKATIDAVNGSGFLALKEDGLNFRARRAVKGDTVLVIGGWNDATFSIENVSNAVRAFVRPQRLLHSGSS